MVDESRKIYVDVNVFVYWLGNHPTFGKPSYQWIKKIEESLKKKYVTSALTVYETMVIMAGLTAQNLKHEELVKAVVDPFENLPGLKVIPFTSKEAVDAVKFMKEYSLDYEDALHLAAALKSGAKEIISNDEDFDRTPLKRRFT